MPKPQAKNSFFYFMLEHKDREQRRGRNISLADASREVSSQWQEMSPAQRAPYEARAKSVKSRGGSTIVEKYSSQGIPLSRIEKEKKQKDLEERLMKKTIEDTVKNCFANDTLATQNYYFVMGNYFAKTIEGHYIPAEIALSRYSLQHGVINKFHSFINPGSLPIGMGYQAKSHSDETHRLPLPPTAMGEAKFGSLMKEILKFLEIDETGEYPPLYTHNKEIGMVKSILSTLQNEYFGADETEINLRVFPLQYLYFQMKTATAEKGEAPKPESIFMSDAIFDRDTYEYQHGISCDFHDQLDVGKYCPLSCVVRWGYMFSDYMCYDLALDMIPGAHIPINADLSSAKMSASKMSAATSRSSIFDDSKSDVSLATRSCVSTNANTSMTQPKIERRYLDDSKSMISEISFPALDSDPRKKSHDIYDNDSSDDEVAGNNPWATRNKSKARQPNEDSFSYSSILCGKGRGVKTEPPSSNASGTSRGSGRGRLFQQ